MECAVGTPGGHPHHVSWKKRAERLARAEAYPYPTWFILGNGSWLFPAALPCSLPRLYMGSAARSAATMRHLLPTEQACRACARLQTAAHRRLTSPVQEEQGATAPRDRARIVRFTVCEQVYPVALRFAHPRRGMFSALLHHTLSSPGAPPPPSRPHLRGTFQIIR
jgi:hypothetical protein